MITCVVAIAVYISGIPVITDRVISGKELARLYSYVEVDFSDSVSKIDNLVGKPEYYNDIILPLNKCN